MPKLSAKTVVLIVAGVAVVGGVIAYQASRSKVSYETAKVDRGSVVEEVSVTGSISPKTKYDLQPEVSAKVAAIPVAESQSVKAGDLLVKLDTRDIDAKILAQKAAIEQAQAQLKSLQAGPTAQDLQLSQAAVDTAQAQLNAAISAAADAKIALSNAQSNLANSQTKADTLLASKLSSLSLDYDNDVTVAGDAINRLTSQLFTATDLLAFISTDAQSEINATATRAQARTALSALQTAVASAKAAGTSAAIEAAYASVAASLATVKQHADACAAVLNYASSISGTTLASYQLNVSTAQSTLDAALQTLAADKNGYDLQKRLNALDVNAAQIALSSAQAAQTNADHNIDTARSSLAQAQAAYVLKKTGVRPEDIDAQRAQVSVQQAALVGLQAELTKRLIVAPIDSVVTNIPVNAGDTVTPGMTVVSLMTTGKFEIIANISEVDIANVKVGEPVNITLDAFATGEKWTGKVLSIQPAEKVVEGVIFYETKIIFDQEDPRLRSGMTANLDIEVARKDNVLRVPLRALQEESGKQYVQVLAGGKAVRKEVQTGIESNDYAEVVNGLNDGDAVIISTNGKQ